MVFEMPMNSFALSIRVRNSSRFVKVSQNPDNRRHSASGRFWLGTMAIDISIVDVLLRISSVAYRVQRLSFVGKGTLEMAANTELLPED